MNSIKEVLRRFVPEAALGSRTTGSQTEIDRKRLQADLRRVVTRNQTYFNISVGMACVLFLGLLAAVLTHLDRPDWVRGLSIATGVSFMGTIQLTAKLWKTKVAAEMVMALAASLPEDALKSAMAALIRKM